MSFKISDIPLVDNSAQANFAPAPTQSEIPSTPVLGIPQSSAPPAAMLDTFGPSPWVDEDKDYNQALADWYRSGTDSLDNAIFDPDTAFKDMDLDFDVDPEAAKRTLINESWLELNHDEPLAPTDLQRAVQIQVASLAKFNQMANSPEELYELIRKDAGRRKDVKQLGQDLRVAAYDDAMLPRDQSGGYAAFREKIKTHAGYSPENEADYLEAWHETRQAASERVDAFREPLVQVWRAFKMDGNITAAAMDAYAALTPEQRPEFMDALAIRAKALPDEERKTFWQNMGKQTELAISDYGRAAAESFQANSFNVSAGAPGLVPVPGTLEADAATRAMRGELAEAKKDFQLRRNFAADVRKIAREDYDPLKSAFGDEKPGFWENIAYQTPGVTGISLTMAVPVVGVATMAFAMEGQAYETMRGRMLAAGKTDEEATAIAEGLAPVIALPQIALEKVGFGIWSRKLPGFTKALDAVGDRITNRLLRGTMKAGTIATAETAIELTQDSLVYTVQDIAAALTEDVPDVDWGTELSGTWATAPEIFFTMLPLAMLGAAGGLSQESRNAAFSRASTTELIALGIDADGIAAINAANGPSSLSTAVEAAMATRDPNTEAAKAATETLKVELASQRQARTDLERLGYSAPSFTQTSEGIFVFDGDGNELGVSPDLSGALRIARAHTGALDNLEADQVAALGSLMEAAAAAVKLDPSSTVEVNLGEFDPDKATPEMAARFAAQVALKEQAEGGTGEVARSVLGYSVTGFAQGLRETVNKLFRGAAVTDVFHETFHGIRRGALARGTITRADEIALLRSLDTIFAGKVTKEGIQLRFIPENMTDDQISETLLDEAFSEIAEMEILRTRKKDGKGKFGLTRGVISRNLTALSKLMPGVIGKWQAFMQAVRARWGLSLSRAIAMKKAERDGTFDKEGYDAYLDKLLGLDQQTEHDAGVAKEFDRLLAGFDDVDMGDDDIPFSIGGAMAQIPDYMRESLQKAQQMREAGAEQKDIWWETRWVPGKYDGKMRWEIPDDGAVIKGTAAAEDLLVTRYAITKDRDPKAAAPELQDIMRHPALYAAYPQTAQIPVIWTDRGETAKGMLYDKKAGFSGSVIAVRGDLKGEELKSVILHEVQHWIQNFEGFAQGGSPANFQERDLKNEALQQIAEARKIAFDSIPEEFKNDARKINRGDDIDNDSWERIQKNPAAKLAWANYINAHADFMEVKESEDPIYGKLSAVDQYMSLAGEIEARDVQARLRMSPSEREAIPPYFSEKISEKDAIVMQNGIRVLRYSIEQGDLSGASFSIGGGLDSRDNLQGIDTNSPGGANIGDGAQPGNSEVTPRILYTGQPAGLTVIPQSDRTELPLAYAFLTDSEDVAAKYAGTAESEINSDDNYSTDRQGVVYKVEARFKKTLDLDEYIDEDLWFDYFAPKEELMDFYSDWLYQDDARLERIAEKHGINFNEDDLWETRTNVAEFMVENDMIPRSKRKLVAKKLGLQEFEDGFVDPKTEKEYEFDFELDSVIQDQWENKKGQGLFSQDAMDNSPTGQAMVLYPKIGKQILEDGGFDSMKHSDTEVGGITWIALSPDTIPLSQRFNQSTPAASGDASFSLGPAQVAGILSDNALARVTDPRRRTHIMSRIARDFNAMRLQIDRMTALSGIRRSKGDLRREAAAREELAAEEKIAAIHQRFGSILADEDLVKIKSQPVHQHLADPTTPLRGRLKSKAAAIREHPEMFQLHRAGDYDGSDGVSRSVFGGQLMPDQAAQELFDEGLIAEPTADAMWEALLVEQKTVAKFKELLVQAEAEIRAAKLQAKQEANEWLATQGKDQEVNFSDKEEIRRSLRMLDAILLALPAEIRGKIGGYTQISMIATDEARLAYLKDKLAKADKELETFLRVEYAKEWEALLAKAAPKTNEAGQRPTGSIAADAYDVFRLAEWAMGQSFVVGEAEADKWDAIADHPDTEIKEADLARVKAQMIRLTTNWTSADAARREQAVIEGDKLYFGGLSALAIENSRRRERLGKLRTSAIKGTGKTGARMEREAAKQAAATKGGVLREMSWEFLSFGQLVNVLFGEKSDVAKWFNARELSASNAAFDGFQAKANSLESLFDTLSGNRFDGEKLRHRMATVETIKVTDALGVEHKFTDSQAITFLLMWRQEDGRRHMEGIIDDRTGAVTSEWAWNDDAAASIESQLSREGKAVMAFLGQSYGEEYGRINEVFRRIWNVSMPRHKMYAPLSVNPAQGKGDTIMDPVSGDTMGAGMTPGSLKNRSFSAIAEPEFKDAFQVFLTHARQMEHFIAYGEFSRDALGVINRRETRSAILASGGPTAALTLSRWIDYFALGGLQDANMGSKWGRIIGGMLGRISQAALVGRVSVLAMQSLQLAAASFKMPLGSFLTRFAKLTTGQLNWGDAISSEYIQRRAAQMPPIVRDMLQGIASGTPNRAKFLAGKLGQTISGADALFTAGTYAIFYDYHLKITKDPAAAHREAERLTDQVAQPTRTGARSWLEVANQGNPAFRAMWNFSSDPRQKASLLVYEAMRRDTSGLDKAGNVAFTSAKLWIVGGILTTLLRTIIRDLRNDDDDEIFDERYWNPQRLALMASMGPLSAVPFVGGMLEDATYSATGQFMPKGGMLGFLSDPAALPLKWSKGKVEPLKDLETLATGGAGFSGTSAAAASALHIIRDVVGFIENLEGPD